MLDRARNQWLDRDFKARLRVNKNPQSRYEVGSMVLQTLDQEF